MWIYQLLAGNGKVLLELIIKKQVIIIGRQSGGLTTAFWGGGVEGHERKTYLSIGMSLEGSMDGRRERASESRREDLRLAGWGGMM